MKENPQFDKFTETMKKLMAVPKSELREKLDAEKEAKKRKRTRKSRLAAVRALNGKD